MTVKPEVILYKWFPPASSITLPLDEAPIEYEAVNGGWEIVNRPMRQNATDYVGGYDPHRLRIPVLYDTWPNGNLEPWAAKLEWFARKPTKKTEPSSLRIMGFLANDKKWVIESIDWGDSVRNPTTGKRARIFCTVTLLEFVKADIVVRSPAKKVAAKSKATTKTVKVGVQSRIPSGLGVDIVVPEDLQTLAARYLGDNRRWPELAALNGLAGPRSTAVGMDLQVPLS